MPVDVRMPTEFQEGTRSAVSRWLKGTGESVQKLEPLVEIATDKVSVEIPSPASGVLSEILCQESDEVSPGAVLGRITAGGQAVSPPSTTSTMQQKGSPAAMSGSTPELSPAVRKLVAEQSVDLSTVRGTGKGGRITAEDVLAATGGAVSVSGDLGASQFVPHSPMRLSIARHMTESALRTAPHVTAVFEANLARLIDDCEKRKPEFAVKGVKLTYTPYFISAACKALKAVPEANSRWHNDRLELFQECHIGLAVAVSGGLVVPVLRNADRLSLFDLASQTQVLAKKSRENTLAPKDVSGGTFTITNHGMGGSLIATPIIHQPQSAILGIGKIEKRPGVESVNRKDEIVVQPKCYVTLTIDHRVLDGFRANEFLRVFVGAVEGW